MRFLKYQAVVNGDMSGDIASSIVPIQTEVMVSFQAIYTGSPTGTLKIQVSNDQTNWEDYTGSSQSISAAGTFMWDIVNTSVSYIRLFYTFSSGTGVLNVNVFAKGA